MTRTKNDDGESTYRWITNLTGTKNGKKKPERLDSEKDRRTKANVSEERSSGNTKRRPNTVSNCLLVFR